MQPDGVRAAPAHRVAHDIDAVRVDRVTAFYLLDDMQNVYFADALVKGRRPAETLADHGQAGDDPCVAAQARCSSVHGKALP